MTLEQVRRAALALPEATEAPHFDKSSFRVRGRIFATLMPAGDVLHCFVDADTTRAAIARQPSACEELWWGGKMAGVRVNLSAASAKPVVQLLELSWRRKAPKRLIAALDAGVS